MSRRFGRNQRRRAREQIEVLDRLTDTLSERLVEKDGAMFRERQQREKLAQALADIAAMLPCNHVSLPAEVLRTNFAGDLIGSLRWGVEGRMSLEAFEARPDEAIMDLRRVVTMLPLLIESEWNHYAEMVHVTMQLGDHGLSVYRITREALLGMPRAMLIRTVVEPLVDNLMRGMGR